MSGRTNEVQASMNTEVSLLYSLGLLLLPHIGLMLVVNEVDDGSPRVPVVDVVTKSRGINNSELGLELLLLKLGLDDLDLGQLVELLVVTTVVVLRGRNLGREECVDQGRLSETRLACE